MGRIILLWVVGILLFWLCGIVSELMNKWRERNRRKTYNHSSTISFEAEIDEYAKKRHKKG